MQWKIEPWQHRGQQLWGPVLAITKHSLASNHISDYHYSQIPSLALFHFATTLQTSRYANWNGYHAVALSLLRQSIEALSIIELGFAASSSSLPLLQKWDEGQISIGKIRKFLEENTWPSYGKGLWDEDWSDFYSNLAKAVQPYAHYTSALMQWQFAYLPNEVDNPIMVSAGPGAFEQTKWLRIELVRVLAYWSLGRIVLANATTTETSFARDLSDLGSALADSRLLFRRHDWGIQLMGNMRFTD